MTQNYWLKARIGDLQQISALPLMPATPVTSTWASMKSFRPKDGSGEPPAAGRNGERDFHGEKRRNQTHASTTDPDARLYRKEPGQPAKLAYLGMF